MDGNRYKVAKSGSDGGWCIIDTTEAPFDSEAEAKIEPFRIMGRQQHHQSSSFPAKASWLRCRRHHG